MLDACCADEMCLAEPPRHPRAPRVGRRLLAAAFRPAPRGDRYIASGDRRRGARARSPSDRGAPAVAGAWLMEAGAAARYTIIIRRLSLV